MSCFRQDDVSKINVRLNGQLLECIKYLNSHVERNGLVETEMIPCVKEGCKVFAALKRVIS